MSEKTLVRGYWDCQYCGTTGIGGDVRNCPGCQKARDESVTFYMKTKERVSAEEAAKVSDGADWYCSYCNSLNPADAENCKGCGASKADSEKNYFDIQKEKADKAAKDAERKAARNPEPPKKKLSPIRIIGIVVILALIAGLVSCFVPKTKDMTVQDFAWSQSIDLEEYQYVAESDWALPDGADLTKTASEVHHTEQVIDHYETVSREVAHEVLDHYDTQTDYVDQGNGYFEEVSTQVPVYTTEYETITEQQPVYRDEPIYQTKYYYSIWKWVPIDNIEKTGNDQNPVWPEVTVGDNQRLGQEYSRYTVTLADKKGKTTTYSLDQAVWQSLEKGQAVSVKVKSGQTTLLDESGSELGAITEYNE